MSRPTKPSFRHRLEFWAMKGIGRVLVLFPPAVSVNAAALLGALVARAAPVRRKVVRDNLEIAFGSSIDESEKGRLTREAYKALFMLAAETMYLQYGPIDWVKKAIVEVEGREHADRLLREGRQVACVMGHFGNWELAGAFGKYIVKIVAVAVPPHNPLLYEELKSTRARHGIEIVWTGEGNPMRSLVAAIRAGRTLSMMVDQDARSSGIFVPFFGRPASTTETPAALAVRFDMPVIPVFCVRVGICRHRLVFKEPIDPRDYEHLERKEKIATILEHVTKELEDMVRLYPAQYFWFHRRWKSTPEKVNKHREKERRRRRENLARENGINRPLS